MSDQKKSSRKHGGSTDPELHLNQLTTEGEVASGGEAGTDSTTHFIKRAAAETAGEAGACLKVPEELGPIAPRVLLSIITYCYSKGVYSCSEIEEAILHDPELRATLGTNLPDDRSLRKFRRMNREAVRATLERAFREAKRRLGRIPRDRLQKANAEQPPPAAEGQTSFLVKEAVQDRIQKAMFIDGMTRDLDF